MVFIQSQAVKKVPHHHLNQHTSPLAAVMVAEMTLQHRFFYFSNHSRSFNTCLFTTSTVVKKVILSEVLAFFFRCFYQFNMLSNTPVGVSVFEFSI